jgi:hypothetical protein
MNDVLVIPPCLFRNRLGIEFAFVLSREASQLRAEYLCKVVTYMNQDDLAIATRQYTRSSPTVAISQRCPYSA